MCYYPKCYPKKTSDVKGCYRISLEDKNGISLGKKGKYGLYRMLANLGLVGDDRIELPTSTL